MTIILQKCFRTTYQTENKQLISSSNFYSSVCLQSSLPACLSPSLPHMCPSLHERQQCHHQHREADKAQQHGMPRAIPALRSRTGDSTPSTVSPLFPGIILPEKGECPQCWGQYLPPLQCFQSARGWGCSSREGNQLQLKMLRPPGAHVIEAWTMRDHHEVRAALTKDTC